jgi:ATP-dependent Lon protease
MYCKYIYKKGKKSGETCNEVCHLNLNTCKRHQAKTKDKSSRIIDSIPVIRINDLVTKKLSEDYLKEVILNIPTSDTNKAVILKHYNNMKRSSIDTTEYYKNQIFVDTSLSYPWNTSYNIHEHVAERGIKEFINLIKSNLDNEIHGMESVKNEILNVVCKFITNPCSNRNNIALCGAAGVGKSKFVKVLSNVLNIPIKSISLGGVRDSSFFLGHGYVYVESGPGKILQNIVDCKINNPIIYFDELDKVSETDNGKDIFSFLCYLTDPSQNAHFSDHYFYGMHFDLSKVFYIFTFNDINKIDKILLDRLNIINVEMPKEQDIVYIIEKHCIPEIISNIGIKIPVIFDTPIITRIIRSTTINKSVTSGIREYYRIIEKILLELNKDILLGILPNNPESVTESVTESVVVINDKLFMKLFENIKHQINYLDETNTCQHMYI